MLPAGSADKQDVGIQLTHVLADSPNTVVSHASDTAGLLAAPHHSPTFHAQHRQRAKRPIWPIALCALVLIATAVGLIAKQLTDPPGSPEHATTTLPALLTFNTTGSTTQHALLLLENGLEVRLVSSPLAPASSVAVAVGAGSFDEVVPGSAHFLEHLLFLGAPPSLAAAGGWDNAYTADSVTNYFFQVPGDSGALATAAQRLGSFFTRPNASQSIAGQEVAAVNSEYEMDKGKDAWRAQALLQLAAKPGQAFARFTIGSYATLGNLSVSVPAAYDFRYKWYHTDCMRAAAVSNVNVSALASMLVHALSDMPQREHPGPSVAADLVYPCSAAVNRRATTSVRGTVLQWETESGKFAPANKPTAAHAWGIARQPGSCRPCVGRTDGLPSSVAAEVQTGVYPFRASAMPIFQHTVPAAGQKHSVTLNWMTRAAGYSVRNASRPGMAWLAYILGDESAGSIVDYLRTQHVATGLSAGMEYQGAGYSVLSVSIALAPVPGNVTGCTAAPAAALLKRAALGAVGRYLQALRAASDDELSRVWRNYMALQGFNVRLPDLTAPATAASQFAAEAWQTAATDAVQQPAAYRLWDAGHVRWLLSQLNLSTLVVQHMDPASASSAAGLCSGSAWQKEQWFGVPYRASTLSLADQTAFLAGNATGFVPRLPLDDTFLYPVVDRLPTPVSFLPSAAASRTLASFTPTLARQAPLNLPLHLVAPQQLDVLAMLDEAGAPVTTTTNATAWNKVFHAYWGFNDQFAAPQVQLELALLAADPAWPKSQAVPGAQVLAWGLNALTTPRVYSALQTGSSVRWSGTPGGALRLSVSAWRNHVQDLVSVCLTQLLNVTQATSPDLWAAWAAEAAAELRDEAASEQPYSTAQRGLAALTRQGQLAVPALASAMAQATHSSMSALARNMTAAARGIMLVYGNVDVDSSRALAMRVAHALRWGYTVGMPSEPAAATAFAAAHTAAVVEPPEPGRAATMPARNPGAAVTAALDQTRFALPGCSTSLPTSATLHAVAGSNNTCARALASLALLQGFAREDAFDNLRTEQQLGYVATGWARASLAQDHDTLMLEAQVGAMVQGPTLARTQTLALRDQVRHRYFSIATAVSSQSSQRPSWPRSLAMNISEWKWASLSQGALDRVLQSPTSGHAHAAAMMDDLVAGIQPWDAPLATAVALRSLLQPVEPAQLLSQMSAAGYHEQLVVTANASVTTEEWMGPKASPVPAPQV